MRLNIQLNKEAGQLISVSHLFTLAIVHCHRLGGRRWNERFLHVLPTICTWVREMLCQSLGSDWGVGGLGMAVFLLNSTHSLRTLHSPQLVVLIQGNEFFPGCFSCAAQEIWDQSDLVTSLTCTLNADQANRDRYLWGYCLRGEKQKVLCLEGRKVFFEGPGTQSSLAMSSEPKTWKGSAPSPQRDA